MAEERFELVKSEELPETFTIQQIADKLGRSYEQTAYLLRESCIEPVIPANTRAGKPAVYSKQQVIEIVSNFNNRLTEPVLNTPEATALVVKSAIETLRADESDKGTEAIVANAAGFFQMMMERLAKVQDTKYQLEAHIEELEDAVVLLQQDNAELEIKLDESFDYSTVKRVNILFHMKLGSSAGKQLASYCRNNGLMHYSIPAPNFGNVGSYPAEAWLAVFNINLNSIKPL
jgi:hypothetical protein